VLLERANTQRHCRASLPPQVWEDCAAGSDASSAFDFDLLQRSRQRYASTAAGLHLFCPSRLPLPPLSRCVDGSGFSTVFLVFPEVRFLNVLAASGFCDERLHVLFVVRSPDIGA
jgi:hypothetical protein